MPVVINPVGGSGSVGVPEVVDSLGINYTDRAPSTRVVNAALANAREIRDLTEFPLLNVRGTTAQFIRSLKTETQVQPTFYLVGDMFLTDMPNGMLEAEAEVSLHHRHANEISGNIRLTSHITAPYLWSFSFVDDGTTITGKWTNIPVTAADLPTTIYGTTTSQQTLNEYLSIRTAPIPGGAQVTAYFGATSLSTVRPTANVDAAFALVGTNPTVKAFTGILAEAGVYSPNSNYNDILYITGLRSGQEYAMNVSYSIKGQLIYSTGYGFAIAGNENTPIIHTPVDQTYNTAFTWQQNDTYVKTISINKADTNGPNHTVNISQRPNQGRFSYMERNGGAIYDRDVVIPSQGKTLAEVYEKFLAPTEKAQILGSKTGDLNIDCALGNIATLTATGNITFSFTAAAEAPQARLLTLIITNGGSYNMTYPASVNWGGSAPALRANGVNILSFLTYDNGLTWLGSISR